MSERVRLAAYMSAMTVDLYAFWSTLFVSLFVSSKKSDVDGVLTVRDALVVGTLYFFSSSLI